jgi:hypothetical protein
VNTVEPPAPPTPEAPVASPDDADALRGFHFKRLMRKPLTLVLIGVAVLIAAGGAAAFSAPVFGLVAAAATLLVGIAIVFWIADSRAAEAFFEAYAQQHDLVLGGRSDLPPATPLLRKGDDRYAERTLTGQLGENIGGILALYTYETKSTDANGSTETNYYRYTLGLAEVPECVSNLPELYCQRKFGLRSLEKFEDVFRRSKERVKLESEALDKRYEIFAAKEQDAVWLRRLFTPTFIVWLTESAPEKFAFELVDGTLCCYVSGHKEDSADLDAIAAGTAAVARRLVDESSG